MDQIRSQPAYVTAKISDRLHDGKGSEGSNEAHHDDGSTHACNEGLCHSVGSTWLQTPLGTVSIMHQADCMTRSLSTAEPWTSSIRAEAEEDMHRGGRISTG